MSIVNLKTIIEALIFVSESPLTTAELAAVLDEADSAQIKQALAELAEEYQRDNRSFVLSEVAGGWQFRTRPEFAGWVRRLLKQRPARLSRPALEVLAIIAYKQPISRARIDQMRGVDSSGVLKTLHDRRLVRVVGRDETAAGRPLLYGTTREFLEAFGFKSLSDLPPLSEIEQPAAGGGTQLELPTDRQEETYSAKSAPEPPSEPSLDDIMPYEQYDFTDEEHEEIGQELADIMKHLRQHHPQIKDEGETEGEEAGKEEAGKGAAEMKKQEEEEKK